jgi:ubiquinone/menaquinone biosynthesis C-methylase UbiE
VKRCVTCERSFDGPEWACPYCGFTPDTVGEITRFAAPNGRDGFDPDAFDRLAQLEHESFWFRARNRLIDWAVCQYFPCASSLLEIGCGTGFVLEGLSRTHPRLQLIGADLHSGGLAHAAARIPGLSLLQSDARRIPFDAEFDILGAFDVLEHIDDDAGVLAEMHRAVKPGGGILITVPQHPWLWSASDEQAEHKRRYRRDELLARVSTAGFTIRRVTSFVTLLLPAMAIIRLRGRVSRDRLDPSREHVIAQRATAQLEQILMAEHAMISRGVDLPVGGSLLVVAERRA